MLSEYNVVVKLPVTICEKLLNDAFTTKLPLNGIILIDPNNRKVVIIDEIT